MDGLEDKNMQIEDVIAAQVAIIRRDLDLLQVYEHKEQCLEVSRLRSLMEYLQQMVDAQMAGKKVW